MSRRLFGTDGVRGLAGAELTAETALRLGWAAVGRGGGAASRRPRVLVVRDPRESGEMLEAAFAAGVSSAGGEVLQAGVLPTPAAPLLLRRYDLDLAAVISASHNPYQANGIKLFGADGFKLSDEQEIEIEAELERWPASPGVSGVSGVSGASGDGEPAAIGRVRALRGAYEDYARALHERFQALDLAGMKVALDCANGSTHAVAPDVFRRLGAEVSVLADRPDGRNINARCGSTDPGTLVELMRGGEHDVGFAFDGDGDRVIAVDRAGEIVDGDELMALIATHLQRAGRLAGEGVVVTVMTNFGFHAAMRDCGIAVATTKVGDRYVLEELRSRGWALGGEQSGHIIEMGFNASGDGIASALLTLQALEGAELADRGAMRRLPQRLINVPVAGAAAHAAVAELQEEIDRAARELDGRGRVLVRPSGTEPLVRVMVEAPSEREASEICERLAERVRREHGAAAS